VPVLLIPWRPRRPQFLAPSFDPVLRPVMKWAAEISEPDRTIELMRRA
jgi:hypothetical protein